MAEGQSDPKIVEGAPEGLSVRLMGNWQTVRDWLVVHELDHYEVAAQLNEFEDGPFCGCCGELWPCPDDRFRAALLDLLTQLSETVLEEPPDLDDRSAWPDPPVVGEFTIDADASGRL